MLVSYFVELAKMLVQMLWNILSFVSDPMHINRTFNRTKYLAVCLVMINSWAGTFKFSFRKITIYIYLIYQV